MGKLKRGFGRGVIAESQDYSSKRAKKRFDPNVTFYTLSSNTIGVSVSLKGSNPDSLGFPTQDWPRNYVEISLKDIRRREYEGI